MGGVFKAISLLIGMDVVVAGSQTGKKEDYEELRDVADDGTIAQALAKVFTSLSLNILTWL